MTEKGIGTGREHRGKAPTALRETGVADRINALMKPVQPTVLHRAGNGALRVTQPVNKLPNRDDAVLPRRKIREEPVASFGP